jgi:hypothetical protein
MHKLFYLRGILIHLDHDGLVATPQATPPPSSEPELDVFGSIPVNPRNNENVDSFSFNTFHNKLAHAKDIYLVSPSFQEACISCSTSGEYSSTWIMMAS